MTDTTTPLAPVQPPAPIEVKRGMFWPLVKQMLRVGVIFGAGWAVNQFTHSETLTAAVSGVVGSVLAAGSVIAAGIQKAIDDHWKMRVMAAHCDDDIAKVVK